MNKLMKQSMDTRQIIAHEKTVRRPNTSGEDQSNRKEQHAELQKNIQMMKGDQLKAMVASKAISIVQQELTNNMEQPDNEENMSFADSTPQNEGNETNSDYFGTIGSPKNVGSTFETMKIEDGPQDINTTPTKSDQVLTPRGRNSSKRSKTQPLAGD